ncbi:MAG: response regulator, partial [Planctomycetaceae bacterium]|nr:response regulator [Planctomycetaceae bacterium]
DLLLTDLVMPGMNGRELAELLRDRIHGLPVVYLSGYPRDGVAVSSNGHQPPVVLEKPFGADELIQAVRNALDRRIPQTSVPTAD